MALVLSCRKQTAEMIKTAAQKPTERKEYIQKCLRDFTKLPEDPVVQAFKMSMDPNFLKVCTKILSVLRHPYVLDLLPLWCACTCAAYGKFLLRRICLQLRFTSETHGCAVCAGDRAPSAPA